MHTNNTFVDELLIRNYVLVDYVPDINNALILFESIIVKENVLNVHVIRVVMKNFGYFPVAFIFIPIVIIIRNCH